MSDHNPRILGKKIKRIIEKVRTNEPSAILINTRRLAPHSKGDDNRSENI